MSTGLGKKIRALRVEKNISLPELAEKAKVSKGFLSELENDDAANPSLDTLNRVAKVLGVSLAVLLERESVKAKRLIPASLAPGLKEFIHDCHADDVALDEDILQALYVIQERRGQAVKTKQDWQWLYESIRRGLAPAK